MEGTGADLDGVLAVFAVVLSVASLAAVWLVARRSDSGWWRSLVQVAAILVLGYTTILAMLEWDVMPLQPSGDLTHAGAVVLMYLALNLGIMMIGWIIVVMLLRASGSATRSRAGGAG